MLWVRPSIAAARMEGNEVSVIVVFRSIDDRIGSRWLLWCCQWCCNVMVNKFVGRK